jgi:hypothetical protein
MRGHPQMRRGQSWVSQVISARDWSNNLPGRSRSACAARSGFQGVSATA